MELDALAPDAVILTRVFWRVQAAFNASAIW